MNVDKWDWSWNSVNECRQKTRQGIQNGSKPAKAAARKKKAK